ncbi:MAG: DMT family transporter [Candidatus Omnitrophica bacterium]|nr:DMT family transporter [Candidatus Omnitrophota bacterium]
MTRSKPLLSAIRFMIQGAVAFSVMTLCVKFVSRSLPSTEIVFFRSLIGCLMLFPLMLKKKISIFGHKSQRRLMFMRGLSGFIALSLHFYTITHLPLGTAVMLNYTSPIFSAIFAMGFLNEKPSALLISMIFVSFSGVILLVKGQFPGWNPYLLLALLSAVFASIAYVLIRAIHQRESPLTVIFYFTSISTVGSLFLLPMGFRWPDLFGWLLLMGVGIGSFYGQLWMTLALRQAPASLVSPFCYFTPLLNFIYGAIFFGDILTGRVLTGAFLIILGGSLIAYYETKAGQKITIVPEG